MWKMWITLWITINKGLKSISYPHLKNVKVIMKTKNSILLFMFTHYMTLFRNFLQKIMNKTINTST